MIDLDGSCADYDKAMVQELNKIKSPGEDELETIPYGMVSPHIEHRMDLIKKLPGFWSNLDPIPIGLDICQLLKQRLGYELMVLTKGPKRTLGAWTEKAEWVAKYLPFADLTITHKKSLTYGKVLYDDFPPYILGWLSHRPRGRVLMLDSPYNHGFEHPNVLRVQRYQTLQAEQITDICNFLNTKPKDGT